MIVITISIVSIMTATTTIRPEAVVRRLQFDGIAADNELRTTLATDDDDDDDEGAEDDDDVLPAKILEFIIILN